MMLRKFSWLITGIFLVILLSACAIRPSEPPAVILADVHSGGSALAFSQSGLLLASGGWEGTLRLWQLPDGSPLTHWHDHSDSVNGIVFIEADRQVVTAGYDGILVRRTVEGVRLQRVDTQVAITHMEADIRTDRLVTGHSDGSVRLWKASDLTLLHQQNLHDGSVKAVAIHPQMARYASSSSDGSVAVWSETGQVQQMDAPPADAWTLAFSPDGQWLSGGSWFRLYRWNLDGGALTVIKTTHHGIIKAIQYTGHGDELATISRQTDSSVYFLDPVTGEATRRFQQHDLCGADVTVSPDGRYMATTSDDASVRIWLLEDAGL